MSDISAPETTAAASPAPEAWRVTLPCTRAEAEAVPFEVPAFAHLPVPPTLMTTEPDAHAPDAWVLEAFFVSAPTADDLAALRALAPSAGAGDVTVEPVYPADWVVESQRQLRPITAGRFHIYTRFSADSLRPHHIGLRIEAGQAFGTGQHATTSGCLGALDRLARCWRPRNALDLGTGSGILAFAIAKRWPRARVTASDIDPVSVRVAAANARQNGVGVGVGAGRISFATAAGLAHATLRANAPYDLITANILAPPLIAMAADISAALAPGGVLILAGLLDTQEAAVAGAYRAHGLKPVFRSQTGDWPTLVLRR
ncbi:50S ribosomal protein L11 methyltransferase [Parapedomonas caeni]